MDHDVRQLLQRGTVIPACPLALTERRSLDERRQRAVCRYYLAAGAGGVAVGVHTTQFAIRDSQVGLFEPVLSLVAEELKRCPRPLVRIAGVCGLRRQALSEAELVSRLGYHAALLSLQALRDASVAELVEHCRAVAEILPIIGFYLQPAVGGRVLSYDFWRKFLEIENVAAIKIAPFNRYHTLDVARALADSDRKDVALYTGNDDQIVLDLLTPFRFQGAIEMAEQAGRAAFEPEGMRIVGGLLGQWAVWTRKAVELLERCQAVVHSGSAIPQELLQLGVQVTDCNAAFFDAANGFAGCIAGLHEVLRRQGLFAGTWCLDPREGLSAGQAEEIDRVYGAYPHLNDDAFVEAHRDDWLKA